MKAYILRRLLLIIPTLLGIMLLNFLIVQFAPGGPVEKLVAQLEGKDSSAQLSGGGMEVMSAVDATEGYRGRRGLDPEFIKQLEKQFGFDKPPIERFQDMIVNYATFDFGNSFYQDRSVIDLIIDKLPVSISLGVWTTLLIYLISIPLGIKKATRDGTGFDVWTSFVVVIGYAIPAFLFAIMLILLFAGGSFLDIFPLRNMVSSSYDEFPQLSKFIDSTYHSILGSADKEPTWLSHAIDYFWHLALPVLAMVIGGFATLTMLTKNSFLDEINKQYVLTARAKGLSERKVLYGHVFRNAMLIVIAGFPAILVTMLFTGSLLIEVIFSLDGMGLLSYESVLSRDYPVFFGTLFIFTLMGLVLTLIRDIMYMLIDPRIDFSKR